MNPSNTHGSTKLDFSDIYNIVSPNFSTVNAIAKILTLLLQIIYIRLFIVYKNNSVEFSFLPCGFRAWNPSGRQGNKIFNWLSLLDTSDFAIFNAYSIQWPKVQILCIYSFKFICLFSVFVCAYSHATVHVCGCQRTTCRNWFSPTICILGIKLRSLGLALSTYTR